MREMEGRAQPATYVHFDGAPNSVVCPLDKSSFTI